MSNDNSFAIDFIIRKIKSDKSKALIYARVTVNGERREISLREQIEAKDWLAAKQMERKNH